jgi:Na+-driven multidrug efflux pump
MKFSFEIKWAFIFTAVLLLWVTLERLVGLHDQYIHLHYIFTNFFMLAAVAVFSFAFRAKKKELGGAMTYKQALISGVIISFFVMLITPFSQYIVSTIITPHYFENAINYSVGNNLQTPEEAAAYFSLKNYMLQATAFAPIAGIVTSAVVALFFVTKKK